MVGYGYFLELPNGRSREKQNIWRSDLLTLSTLSASTIGILSKLAYTEIDCAALLSML